MPSDKEPKFWQMAATDLGSGLALKPALPGKFEPTTLRESIDTETVLDALDKILHWLIAYEAWCARNQAEGEFVISCKRWTPCLGRSRTTSTMF